MSFHRGGLGGLFDALTELVHERAKRERAERKQDKRTMKLAHKASKIDVRLQEAQGSEAEQERLRHAVHATHHAEDIPSWATPPRTPLAPGVPVAPGAPMTAEQALADLHASVAGFDASIAELTESMGGALPPPGYIPPSNAKPSAQVAFESARAATKPPATLATTTEPALELERSVASFDEDMTQLAESLGGTLPGEAAKGHSTTGNNPPGLAGGATALPFAPPQKPSPIGEVKVRIQTALGALSSVPWIVEHKSDIIIIRTPDVRTANAKEDARALQEAFGVPVESPQIMILPARQTFFVEQVEARAKLKINERSHVVETVEIGPRMPGPAQPGADLG